jgi:hypothetical protein
MYYVPQDVPFTTLKDVGESSRCKIFNQRMKIKDTRFTKNIRPNVCYNVKITLSPLNKLISQGLH